MSELTHVNEQGRAKMVDVRAFSRMTSHPYFNEKE